MANLLIVCTLTPEALRARREGFLSDLVRRAEDRDELPGRAYAAYGGIYIVASLAWLGAVEGQTPTRTDVVGAALAIGGALVIISFAARVR